MYRAAWLVLSLAFPAWTEAISVVPMVGSGEYSYVGGSGWMALSMSGPGVSAVLNSSCAPCALLALSPVRVEGDFSIGGTAGIEAILKLGGSGFLDILDPVSGAILASADIDAELGPLEDSLMCSNTGCTGPGNQVIGQQYRFTVDPPDPLPTPEPALLALLALVLSAMLRHGRGNRQNPAR